MWAAFRTFPQRRPVLFGCGFSALKTSAADYVTQKYVEGREEIDHRRNLVFFTWGALYLGGVQYFIYVELFGKRMFPQAAQFAAQSLRQKLRDTAGQRRMLAQVAIDQFLHHPFMLFPCFYMVKETIEGGALREGLRKCWSNWSEDCVALWKLWIPAFVVNFSFCPMHMRVPMVAVVSFVWTCYFSFLRGAPQSLEVLE